MSFYALQDALELALLFQYHDANCRHDLNKGFITSERDYVSNLATHSRYPTGSRCDSRIPTSIGLPKPVFDGSITSFTLPPVYEQKLGFDGIIILSRPALDSNKMLYKIGFFEAKWPRTFGGHRHLYGTNLRNPDSWDSKASTKDLYRNPPIVPPEASHFSIQLSKQQALARSGAVLWEQFFSEESVGTSSDSKYLKFGSTCVFHKEAFRYMRRVKGLNPRIRKVPNITWKRRHLSQLFTVAQPCSIARIIFGMARCELGLPISGSGTQVRIPNSSLSSPHTSGSQLDNQFSNGRY